MPHTKSYLNGFWARLVDTGNGLSSNFLQGQTWVRPDLAPLLDDFEKVARQLKMTPNNRSDNLFDLKDNETVVVYGKEILSHDGEYYLAKLPAHFDSLPNKHFMNNLFVYLTPDELDLP